MSEAASGAARALPSGTVTFLFTDIEGSTQLVHHLGGRYAQVLDEHRRLLRAAIQEHRGCEVDTQGDSFFIAFQHARDALAAAVQVQHALNAHRWPEDVKVSVRMGLHTGEPIMGATGYVGIDVHRAARLSAAGHGGQILLTQATRDAAGDALPTDATLCDLGQVRLKDLRRPERVYQLNVPGLYGDFPPLRSLDSLAAHYEAVIRALAEGRAVPFLGAGVNACGRPAAQKWQYGQTDVLPSRHELAEYLAKTFDYPPHEPLDLVRVSEFIALNQGIGRLYDELRKLLKADYRPTSLHQFLASLPATWRAKGYPPNQLIVTTNYDDTLERAFRAAGEEFDLVYYVAEGEQQGKFMHHSPDGKLRLIEKPNKYLNLAPDERTTILKMYGVVDRASRERDSYVITEDHYIDYLAHKDIAQQMPAKLLEKMSWSHFLFLGYTLRDWNLRVILHRMWGEQKLKYKSWAVQRNPPPVDKHFWLERDVDVLDVPLEEYVEALSERVQALPPAAGGA